MPPRPQKNQDSRVYVSSYEDAQLISIAPWHYLYVRDTNKNIVRVENGPQRLTLLDHEQVVEGPTKMIMLGQRQYCRIEDPCVRNAQGKPIFDELGQIKLRHGDYELRFDNEPFPLYPGEKLVGSVQSLSFVPADVALRLRALRDFEENGVRIQAGQEWLFRGPSTYVPHVTAHIVENVQAIIIRPNQALHLRARNECVDYKGVVRKPSEEWLVREVGSYLPQVEEVVVAKVEGRVLTPNKALYLLANTTFTDVYGIERKAGEEWLVTQNEAEVHIPDVNEKVVADVNLVVLDETQYVVIRNPVDENGKSQRGKSEIRSGPCTFFLQPGEVADSISTKYLIREGYAVVVNSNQDFVDKTTNPKREIRRKAGQKWYVYGPRLFVPSIEMTPAGSVRALINASPYFTFGYV